MFMSIAVAAMAMDSTFSTTTTTTALLIVGASCFVLGYVVAAAAPPGPSTRLGSAIAWLGSATARARARDATEGRGERKGKQESAPLEIESLADIFEDFKMVLVVRNDLKMGKGKIAAQCSHATLGLYKKLFRKAPKALNRWEMCGQVKVVLKSESEADLLNLQERAKCLKLPTHITIDAGRTQIAPNSRTVMAILGPEDVVDDVTGGLKLL